MCLLFRHFNILSPVATDGCVGLLLKRTHAEDLQLSSALRSFYFRVHPDFFTRHPRMRATNEESLKVLQQYYLNLQRVGHSPTPTKGLKFFVRSVGTTRDAFREISVDLVGTDPRLLAKSLLSKCNLPDCIRPASPISTRKRSNKSLTDWIGKLAAQADQQIKRAEMANGVVARLTARMCSMYKLNGILWSDHFSRELFLPSLHSLLRALECFPEVVPSLRGWNLMFGKGNCISADGTVVLNPLDVSERWLGVLVSLAHCGNLSSRVATTVQEVSICLSGLNVLIPKGRCVFSWLDQCSQLVDTFKRSTVKVCYDRRYRLLNALLLGDSACDVCVTAAGLLMIPCGVSPTAMQVFLKCNVDQALDAQFRFRAATEEVERLRRRIIDKYSLRVLTVDDSGKLDVLIASLHRLLHTGEAATDCLRGRQLHLAGSVYSVLRDGRIVVPLDWQ